MEINNIKSVGPKTNIILNKLNIFSEKDLLEYFPYRYDVIKRTNMQEALDESKVIIDGYLEEDAKIYRYKSHSDRISFRLNTGNNIYKVFLFNRGFLKPKLLLGAKVTIIGKLDLKNNTIIASDINFSLLNNYTTINPIYHVIKGISSKQLNEVINHTFNYVTVLEDYIPDFIKEKYNFIDKIKAIHEIHNPSSTDNFKKALLRLKYEELFTFILKITYLKETRLKKHGIKRDVSSKDLDDFISKLPFELTLDQKKASYEIYNDLINKSQMNRLLQGDVGSGKTIVSFIALYINYLSGYQAALMAPTEILAHQHYHNLLKIFKDYNINIKLLTGKINKSSKKKIYEEIKDGHIDILVGTHALFQEDIKYNNLGLVITDEQHRFGVNERANLKNKGNYPDVLYMSATPIPRTYALTIYGDMDISSIKTMPSGRKDIKTLLYSDKEIKDVLKAMYKELNNKHQIYVVAPLIEESENSDLVNANKLKEEMTKAFGKKYNIAVLHGKMKDQEKEAVMDDFKENKTQILVSTTVIEVGVDVANATMIVIFDAYKFGLSSLHQLRGRVGRNNLDSYCLLISNKQSKRLEILTKINDGFLISEEDFKMRGSGDLFGYKQSGDMNFKIANIKEDFNILMRAKEDALTYIKETKSSQKEIEKLLEKASNLD